MCRRPCGDVQAAMWWGGGPCNFSASQSFCSWLWDFGLCDFRLGLDKKFFLAAKMQLNKTLCPLVNQIQEIQCNANEFCLCAFLCVWVPIWTFKECTQTESVQDITRKFHNVAECMHAECSRMLQNVAECSRMHAECSRMLQNAPECIQNVTEFLQNVPECMQNV